MTVEPPDPAALLAGRDRPPQPGIPPTRDDRDRLRRAVEAHVAAHGLRPQLSLAALREHAGRVLRGEGGDPAWRDWLTVLLNNATWAERLAAVPFDRRLFLLPKCLRDDGRCPAEFDALGLVCRGCGLCPIHPLQQEAARLGYVVLVSEGTAAVLSLVQTGRIEAFVGASCMNALEEVFPVMEMAAVPAIAIPLLYDGCRDTNIDLDWLRDAMHLSVARAAAGPRR